MSGLGLEAGAEALEPVVAGDGERWVRVPEYLDIDVLTAARQRLEHIYDTHDKVVVMFSGGKDSLTVLHLVRQFHEQHGLGKVEAIFRDEEVIPFTARRFVEEYHQKEWLKLRWIVYPMRSERFVLGKTFQYIQWDPNRPHMVDPPAWGEYPEESLRGQVFDQWTMDEILSRPYRGKVCFLTGVRAAESVMRRYGVMAKVNEPWLCASSCLRVQIGRPIYDWSENDVFKFFHDQQIAYCPIYEAQRLSQSTLRVATPFVSQGAKSFGKLRKSEPEFYARCIELFPDMLLQERYYGELAARDHKAAAEQFAHYSKSFDSMRDYIRDHVAPEFQAAIAKNLERAEGRHAKNPHAYPLDHIFQSLVNGSLKKPIVPLKKTEQNAKHRRPPTPHARIQ